MIYLLNKIVKIPITTSIKNVEKPVTDIAFNLLNIWVGFTKAKEFLFDAK